MNKGLKNEKGTALLMTLMVLTSALTVALGAASLILPGIFMGRTQTNSTKAFFASETGAERTLWLTRKQTFDDSSCAGTIKCIDFDANPNPKCVPCSGGTTFNLSNNASYQVEHDKSTVIYDSNGTYLDTKRRVEISY